MPIIDESLKVQAREFLAINNMPESVINKTIRESVIGCMSFPYSRTKEEMNHIFNCFIHGSLEVFRSEQSKHEKLMKKRFNKTLTCTIIKGDDVTVYEYKRF